MNNKANIFPIILLILVGTMTGACQPESDSEITLQYAENAQFEISIPNGVRIFIDVHNPNKISQPPTEADILLTTHGHRDHLNSEFVENFPGQQLFIQEGQIEAENVSIMGIPATHTAYGSDEMMPEGGSNYIYVIEIGGMRIAHFGDIGQESITAEQLEKLGEIDIAITQFVNSFSQMDLNNEKGFNLIKQLQPKLIIPTHGNGNMDAMGHSAEIWNAYVSQGDTVVVSESDLTEETQFIIMGIAANSMQAIFDLSFWGE